MNKRIILHICFWIFNIFFFAVFEFLWDRTLTPTLTYRHILNASIVTSLSNAIPRMLFSYYLVYYSFRQACRIKKLRKDPKIFFLIVELTTVLFLCIVMIRFINEYFVFPYFYGDLIPRVPLLDSRKVLVTVVYIGFTSGSMVMIKFVRNQLAAKDKEKAQMRERYESELKFLRNQTNPHFLMNTLNNIYALARKKSDNTAEVVMRLSEMLRFMLYESDGQFISLSDEIKLVENYLELEMIRYDNRLSLSFNKQVDDDCYKITPLLLLPFVENAFKHGISENRFESFIYIDLSVKNGQLAFSIENTKDFSPENNKKNIGLINARRQLELLYKEYLLDVKENGNAFTVCLSINLNSYVEI
jgi:two-component system, LytTR family, sensor kinase